MKNEWNNSWKNHFNEMKGDVGMSSHEKEREQEDVYSYTPRQKVINNPIPTSCFFEDLNPFYVGIWISVHIGLLYYVFLSA